MSPKPFHIAIVGGGPGGLYLAILVKKARPDFKVELFERNKADDHFGFGVVFSDETLAEFLQRDPQSYERIREAFAYWDDIIVARDADQVRISGNGFCGCSRQTLLRLLQERCREEGVELHFEHPIDHKPQADLVVLADGINSGFRQQYEAEFGTQIEWRSNRFVWLGSTKPLDAFTYFFRNTPHGLFVAHSYQYEAGHSTWVMECSNDTWNNAGFNVTDEADTIAKLQHIFAEELNGHPLISNKSHWRQFPHITHSRWHHDNMVLLGDAKASAHFSIGSGTKLAMDCAIGLADAIVQRSPDVAAIFAQYEQKRRPKVEGIQRAAHTSMQWFERMDQYRHLPFQAFAFAVMCRSSKLGLANLNRRDPAYGAQVVADFNQRAQHQPEHTAPALVPYTIKNIRLDNRLVMNSMGQYRAQDGLINAWHQVHYGSRATAGVGLIWTEKTAVSSEGRITAQCAGLYNDAQQQAWAEVVQFVHDHSNTHIGMQLGHSGPRRKEGVSDTPLWAASSTDAQVQVLSEADMDHICTQFEQAALRARAAGFDALQLQAHHGFLLASFLSSATNQRTDAYGGTLEGRLRFPLRVFQAMQQAFGTNRILSVRLSPSSALAGKARQAELEAIAQAFVAAGADNIDISTTLSAEGTALPIAMTYADGVRQKVNVPVTASGGIQTLDQANTLLLAGQADWIGLGRALLWNPGWVRQAQAEAQITPDYIPKPYERAAPMAMALAARQQAEFERMKAKLKPQSNRKS